MHNMFLFSSVFSATMGSKSKIHPTQEGPDFVGDNQTQVPHEMDLHDVEQDTILNAGRHHTETQAGLDGKPSIKPYVACIQKRKNV